MSNPIIEIKVRNFGKMTLKLDSEKAPITVNNFMYLVETGYYKGLIFHRIIRNFMIQGGCPLGNGLGGPDWTIKGEFKENGVDNPIKHTRGVISMARTKNPNSAGSQFFIVHVDSPHLDGAYAAFGKIISGINVLDKIASVRTDSWANRPYEDVVIEEMTIVDKDGMEIKKP